MGEELKQHLESMESHIHAHVSAECEKIETNLLRAFHGWSRGMEIRVRGSVQAVAGFDERLGFVEERISELERRKPS